MRSSDWALSTCDLRLACDVPSSWSGLVAGGLRVDPGAALSEADRLASLMTLKLAVCQVPVGGAKAVAVPRPDADRARMLEEIAAALQPHLAEDYLLGEDLGTTSGDVVSIYTAANVDPVAVVKAHHAAHGRSMDLPAGLRVSDLMNDEFAGVLAGTGAVAALEAVLGGPPTSLDVAVQGFGTVGRAAALEFARRGARVVTVVDVDGYVHDPAGLEVAALGHGAHGRIDRSALSPDVQQGPAGSWLSLPADVLVPAAVAAAITEGNVGHVHPRVRFVVEGANDPLTTAAEDALEGRGVVVLPDFVANAGSAVAFGMLATGQAGVHDIGERYLERIADAVRRCRTHGTVSFRAAAEAEARAFLASSDASVEAI